MKTARRHTPPFATAAQFFRLARLHEHFDRLAEDLRMRRAFESAGFRLRKIQREQFRFKMTTAWASCPVDAENPSINVIRRAILRAFRHEKQPLRAKFLMTRVAGSKLVAAATLIASLSE